LENDFNEANSPVEFSVSLHHRDTIKANEGGRIRSHPQKRGNRYEEPASSPVSYLEGMACRPEGEEKDGEMDSVFITMGGWRIYQNYPTGMIQ